MKNKVKKIFQLTVMGFGLSIIANCAAFDGPSCELTGGMACMDLMSPSGTTYAGAFDLDCTIFGTRSTGPCDTLTYDVPGHCEVTDPSYDYAVFYSSTYYDVNSAEAACASVSNSTWVQ